MENSTIWFAISCNQISMKLSKFMQIQYMLYMMENVKLEMTISSIHTKKERERARDKEIKHKIISNCS